MSRLKLPSRIKLPVSPTSLYRCGSTLVDPAGKPPKLRFRPGSFVRLRGQLYEIMYCFRIRVEPQEWHFCLEERASLSSEPPDALGRALKVMGAGSTTPRVVYEPFRSSYDAMAFFGDIPLNGNRWTVGNKTMMSGAELVSSGEVL